MKYNKILKLLATRDNVSEQQVEKEIQTALNLAGINCSVKEFIKTVADGIIQRTIYSNIV